MVMLEDGNDGDDENGHQVFGSFALAWLAKMTLQKCGQNRQGSFRHDL